RAARAPVTRLLCGRAPSFPGRQPGEAYRGQAGAAPPWAERPLASGDQALCRSAQTRVGPPSAVSQGEKFMGSYEDYDDLMQDEWLSKYVDEELQRLAEAPVFDYLAHYGDAIEDRVRACVSDARALAGRRVSRSRAGSGCSRDRNHDPILFAAALGARRVSVQRMVAAPFAEGLER